MTMTPTPNPCAWRRCKAERGILLEDDGGVGLCDRHWEQYCQAAPEADPPTRIYFLLQHVAKAYRRGVAAAYRRAVKTWADRIDAACAAARERAKEVPS